MALAAGHFPDRADLPAALALSCDVPISADEGGYATVAYWWARGDALYRTITVTRPQGIFVVFRLIEALGLGSVRGIHLFAAGYTALSTLLLLAVANRLWGRAIGLGAAALFTLLMATPYVEGYHANAELFMALPLLASLYLLLRADDAPLGGRGGLGLITGAGLLGALALAIKPSAIAVLAFAALWLSWRWRQERTSWPAWLRAELALASGALLGLAMMAIHGMLTAPDHYLNAVLLYRLQADSLVSGAVGYQLRYFTTNTLYVVGHLAPIFLLAGVGLWATRRAPRQRDWTALVFWFGTALGGMALGGDWFLHYYQQLLPPLAIAAALGARALLCRPVTRAQALPVAVLQVLSVAGLLLLALALWPTFAGPVDPARLPGYEPGISAARPVATYLRDHTAPDDTIYVAYDHADIYYLAQRRPAARWLHFRELQYTPGAFDEQVARLADPATAPRYIVAAQDFDRWGFDTQGQLRALVARDYVLETTIAGVPVYRRKD